MILLGAAEYRLLEVPRAERGRVVTRTDLGQRIGGAATERTFALLEATVRTTCHKVEADAADPAHLLTIPGVGHRFV